MGQYLGFALRTATTSRRVVVCCPLSFRCVSVGDLLFYRAIEPFDPRRCNMLRWALIFLIIAIVAGVMGFGGIAGDAAWIAKILVVVFIVLFLVSLVMGRKV